MASIKILQDLALLTLANSAILAMHERPWAIVMVLSFLDNGAILRQETFDLLFLPEHGWLLSHEARVELWERLPQVFFDEQTFRDLLRYARAEDPVLMVDHYLQGLAAMLENNLNEEGETLLDELNGVDSTHTASVHKTVSESALRLQLRYGHVDEAELQDLLEQATLWMVSIYVEGEKIEVALRAMVRITDPAYSFSDPTSGISLRQLLVLVWQAMHDEGNRSGTLADAKQLWLEALYEIQRGGNLLEGGFDDQGSEDLMICPAGTFNKFIEKLQSIHPDGQISFITSRTASYKLPCVVHEVAVPCLLALARPLSATGALVFTQLVSALEQEGMQVLWRRIEKDVSVLMFSEFHSLYRDSQDPAFVALIKAGQDMDITELHYLQQDLQQSWGYKDYCNGQLKREARLSARFGQGGCQTTVGRLITHHCKP